MENEDIKYKYHIDKFRLSAEVVVGGKIKISRGTIVKILHKFEDESVLVDVLSLNIQAVIPIIKLSVVDKPVFNYDLTPYIQKMEKRNKNGLIDSFVDLVKKIWGQK